MRFIEDAALSGTRTTADGYLVADVRVARTGIQIYDGGELGKPDMGLVNVYRPESAVFNKDSLATFSGKPITDDHPDEPVTADNWKDYAIGDIGEDVLRDGEFIRVPIKLMDAGAIAKVKSGKRELSMGYDMALRWEDGTAPDGTPYQAVMDSLRMNHLALVETARAGSKARIGDGAENAGNRTNWGASPISDHAERKEVEMTDKLQTMVLGDKAVQVAATDIASVEAYKTAQDARFNDAATAHATAIADKDKELATKDAKIAELEKAQISDADLDAKVQARAALVADAKAIDEKIETAGLSDMDIRRKAVEAVRGADAVKDKSDAYIEAAFDLAKDAEPGDQFANLSKDGLKKQVADNGNLETAYAERDVQLADAWKQKVEA